MKRKRRTQQSRNYYPPPPPPSYAVLLAAWFHARKITTTTTSAWQHIHINTPYPSPIISHHTTPHPQAASFAAAATTYPEEISIHHRHNTDRPDPSGPHPLPEGNKERKKDSSSFRPSPARCSLALPCCCCCCCSRSCVSSCRPPTAHVLSHPAPPSPPERNSSSK